MTDTREPTVRHGEDGRDDGPDEASSSDAPPEVPGCSLWWFILAGAHMALCLFGAALSRELWFWWLAGLAVPAAVIVHALVQGTRIALRARPRSRGIGRGAATVFGAVLFSGALIIMGGFVAPWPPRSPDSARRAVCLSNIKNLTLGLQLYLAENDGTFPEAEDWCDRLAGEYMDNLGVFCCPSDSRDRRCSFAYNAALSDSARTALADPTNTVAIFESDGGWNAAGGPELLPEEPRHLSGDNYGFADGHASWSQRESVQTEGRGEMVWETAGNAD